MSHSRPPLTRPENWFRKSLCSHRHVRYSVQVHCTTLSIRTIDSDKREGANLYIWRLARSAPFAEVQGWRNSPYRGSEWTEWNSAKKNYLKKLKVIPVFFFVLEWFGRRFQKVFSFAKWSGTKFSLCCKMVLNRIPSIFIYRGMVRTFGDCEFENQLPVHCDGNDRGVPTRVVFRNWYFYSF